MQVGHQIHQHTVYEIWEEIEETRINCQFGHKTGWVMMPSFEIEEARVVLNLGRMNSSVLAILRFLVEKTVGSLIYESGT